MAAFSRSLENDRTLGSAQLGDHPLQGAAKQFGAGSQELSPLDFPEASDFSDPLFFLDESLAADSPLLFDWPARL